MWIRSLADLQAAVADCPRPVLSSGPDGALSMRSPAGRLVHSLRRPQEEALHATISGPPLQDARPVLFGVGLGYWIEALLSQPLGELLAVEGEPAVLAAWLERMRREPAAVAPLNDPRLRLLAPAGDDALLAALGEAFADEHGERPVFVLPLCAELWRPRLPRSAAFVEDLQARRRSAARREWRLEENRRLNAPRLALARGLAELGQAWDEAETVVCGAGPSLGRCRQLLQAARQRGARLVAVNTAAPVLAGLGLDPDLVVATDPDPLLAQDLLPAPAPPLLCFPGTCPELVAGWPGERLLALPAGPGLREESWLERRPGRLQAGMGTVAGPALAAAALLSRGPLRLCGVDLDASAGSYVAGVRRDPAAPLPDFGYARRQLAIFVAELRRAGRQVEALGPPPAWLPSIAACRPGFHGDLTDRAQQ
jgi:hypothetical protein